MTWTLMRCEHGHEMNATRPLDTCPYPRCDGTPKPIVGPLTKRTDKEDR